MSAMSEASLPVSWKTDSRSEASGYSRHSSRNGQSTNSRKSMVTIFDDDMGRYSCLCRSYTFWKKLWKSFLYSMIILKILCLCFNQFVVTVSGPGFKHTSKGMAIIWFSFIVLKHTDFLEHVSLWDMPYHDHVKKISPFVNEINWTSLLWMVTSLSTKLTL